MWVYECLSTDGVQNLRLLYFHVYVHHGVSCDTPFNVFVSSSDDTGDVSSVKCTCVSG